MLAEHHAGHHQAPVRPSKASYALADGVADRVQAASAELLDKHPLYPGLDLA